MQRKLRVGIVFGGRSGEHEVSVASARSIMAAIDTAKYEVIPIAIDRSGQWLPGVAPDLLQAPAESVGDTANAQMVKHSTADQGFALLPHADAATGTVDIIFPVLHGTYGEDGAIQGLLEMANIPYVGCGILGAATGMDKHIAKTLFQAAGIPVVPWLLVTRQELDRDREAVLEKIVARFGYPVFVKPANMGSSVGVGKGKDTASLMAALDYAARYDRRILVEQSIDCREIECAVLGNDLPEASVVGEIVPSGEFYDYTAKYLDGGASRLLIPAPIPDEVSRNVREAAVKAFQALDLSGLARVDFFLERGTNAIYLNEVNTLPGFTEISMYPKLWEATGLSYREVIDRLIQLGLERYQERSRNTSALTLE